MSDQSTRTYQLKLIHMAKRDLVLSDEDYRALVRRISGGRTDSSGKMTDPERRRLLHHFRVKCAWDPQAKERKTYSPKSAHKAPEQKTQADKIRAMWISLGKAGVVTSPTEASLCRFCYRLTKKRSPNWLNHQDAVAVIQALEAWAKREGVPEVVGL
jgi:phage gp16-like protein